MKTSLVYIFLLLVVILYPVESRAFQSIGEDSKHSSAHKSLSCLDCHSHIKADSDHPSVEDSNDSCLGCHELSSGFTYSSSNKVKCLNCHSRHHEKVAGDAHINVPCKACHQSDMKPLKEIEDNAPVWRLEPVSGEEYYPHRLISEKDDICSRCHFKENNLGASDYALPPKSIICMPCHTATFSIGDIPSAAAVIIFLMGTLSIVFIWFSAGKSRKTDNGASSTGLIHVAEVLILDVLLQRRLFRVSIKRWAIHEMIFLPLLFRFLWGITALVLSLFYPEQDITWIMLDKNNPVTGLFFDITGIIILLGGILMFIEKKMNKILNSITGLPKSDVLVTLLLACIILTGFIVEGARIAMTGFPEGSQYSFTGSLIGRTLTGYHLNGFFAYLWYLHAVVTAVFIAYFPFSRMFHIITAPLGLLLRGSSED